MVVRPAVQRDEQHERIKRIVEEYGLQLEIVPLEAITELGAEDASEEHRRSTDTNLLQALFNNTTTLTSKEDLLVFFRNQLLASIATKCRYRRCLVFP